MSGYNPWLFEIYTKTHSYEVCIIFIFFSCNYIKGTTGLLRTNLQLADSLPQVLSATVEGHTVSNFR